METAMQVDAAPAKDQPMDVDAGVSKAAAAATKAGNQGLELPWVRGWVPSVLA